MVKPGNADYKFCAQIQSTHDEAIIRNLCWLVRHSDCLSLVCLGFLDDGAVHARLSRVHKFAVGTLVNSIGGSCDYSGWTAAAQI